GIAGNRRRPQGAGGPEEPHLARPARYAGDRPRAEGTRQADEARLTAAAKHPCDRRRRRRTATGAAEVQDQSGTVSDLASLRSKSRSGAAWTVNRRMSRNGYSVTRTR